MSKKKKAGFSLGTILIGVGAILGLLVLAFMAMDFVTVTSALTANAEASTSSLGNGYQLAFGIGETVEVGNSTVQLDGEINGGILAFVIIAIVGMAAAIVALLTKKQKYGKFIGLAAALILVVAGILFFISPSMMDPDFLESVDAINTALDILGGYASVGCGAGAILSGICGILGGGCVAVGSLIK